MACHLSYSKMDRACNKYQDIAREYAPDWYLRNRKFEMCNVKYMSNGNGNCVVTGNVDSFLSNLDDEMDLYVQWWAANKPTNVCSNSGFCLPYSNETIAYDNTPNFGITQIKDKKFIFSCGYPSGYYSQLGAKFVKPNIRFRFCDRKNRPVSKVYVLKLTDFQLNTDKQSSNDPSSNDSSYEQPQYMKLIQKGLTKPSWV